MKAVYVPIAFCIVVIVLMVGVVCEKNGRDAAINEMQLKAVVMHHGRYTLNCYGNVEFVWNTTTEELEGK